MEFKVGYQETFKRSFAQDDFVRFADLSSDNNPVHIDPKFSARTRFGRTVAHGMLLSSMICRVLNAQFAGNAYVSYRRHRAVYPANYLRRRHGGHPAHV